ncbi:MAG TPA: type II toxin-antitoxin system VapC family toxin [Candidatus Dormibacteraeota bacterium]|nr:type II toxin-antitoxin system VapC family toxin [Candidatus Dormibacteraeota bacterium]
MTSFVLDASVALAWFIDPAVAPLARRVQRLLQQGGRAIVPHLWRPEVANGFVIAHKRGILTAIRSAQAFSELDLLLAQSIDAVSRDLSIQRVVATAQHFGLTAYDATYLETARDLRLPLATLDQRLAAAAGQAGVSLIS